MILSQVIDQILGGAQLEDCAPAANGEILRCAENDAGAEEVMHDAAEEILSNTEEVMHNAAEEILSNAEEMLGGAEEVMHDAAEEILSNAEEMLEGAGEEGGIVLKMWTFLL